MRSNSPARSKTAEMCRHSSTLGSPVSPSSDQPRAVTEARRADVCESAVAKRVTSTPRATRPFGEQRGELLPGPVVAGRHPPGDGGQHGDPHGGSAAGRLGLLQRSQVGHRGRRVSVSGKRRRRTAARDCGVDRLVDVGVGAVGQGHLPRRGIVPGTSRRRSSGPTTGDGGRRWSRALPGRASGSRPRRRHGPIGRAGRPPRRCCRPRRRRPRPCRCPPRGGGPAPGARAGHRRAGRGGGCAPVGVRTAPHSDCRSVTPGTAGRATTPPGRTGGGPPRRGT